MADKKISALTASSTPLAGTEVLPIVQSSTTKQVSVANLTAGRTVAMSSLLVNSPTVDSSYEGQIYGDLLLSSGAFGAGQTYTLALGDSNAYMQSENGQPVNFGAYNGFKFGFASLGNKTLTSTQVEITTGNDLKVTTGNLVIGTAGTGTSELLNDYEEGTFTATLTSQTPPTTPPTVTARYTKIGRLVNVAISFVFVDTSGGSGAMAISGLPFTAINDATAAPLFYNMTFANVPVAYVASTTTIIYFGDLVSGGALTDLAITAGTGKYVYLSVSYTT